MIGARPWPFWIALVTVLLSVVIPWHRSSAILGESARVRGEQPMRSAAPVVGAEGVADGDDWPMFARDLRGTRLAPNEMTITARNAFRLKPRWILDTGPRGDVTATPAISDGVVYVGSWNGTFYAIGAADGAVRWVFANEFSIDSSAAVEGDRVFFGDAGGYLSALDRGTGVRLWRILPDATCGVHMWGSPVPVDGTLVLGIASDQDIELGPLRTCLEYDFRGSVIRVDQATGAILWQTYLVPPEAAGAAVWSTPSVDPADNAVYVTTGNNYRAPATDQTDAILRLRLDTGEIVWSFQATSGDLWPTPGSPDFDFSGGQPILFQGSVNDVPRALVGAGQKSGVYWALDRAAGEVAWKTRVGLGGGFGGYLGAQAYANGQILGIVNFFVPRSRVYLGGGLVSLGAGDGGVVWGQWVNPGLPRAFPAMSPTAATPSLVFAGNAAGHFFAYGLDGRLRWWYRTGASMYGGAAIAGGAVYVGSGSGVDGFGSRGNRIYAFSLDGK